MKVLIIGLDGATWDVIDDHLLANHMPNLKHLRDKGTSGVLHSTEPPITPAAWTTSITGCNPQTHGVVGFREYSIEDNTLSFSNAGSSFVPNMFEQLSEQGYKVAAINVPWTFPPRKVNGIMLAGFGAPGIFSFPEEFAQEVLKQIPDYDILARWERSEGNTFEQLNKKVTLIERSIEQRLEIARLVSGRIDWDLMMLVFQDIDKIGHYMWAYIDKDLRDEYPAHRDRMFRMFEKLDEVLGKILDLTDRDSTQICVISDHGMGKRLFDLKPNWLLHKWGYLKFQNSLRRMIRRLRRNIFSGRSIRNQPMPIELKMPVDWRRSRAIVLLTAISGYVTVNVKDRRQEQEYDKFLDELADRFRQVECPFTGNNVFTRVQRPQSLYAAENLDPGRFGDLVLVPQPGYFLKSTVTTKGNYVQLPGKRSLEGCHRPEGMFLFAGPNIKAEKKCDGRIVDIAPTVYAAIGAKLPRYMDGSVMEQIFETKPQFQYQSDTQDVSGAKREKQNLTEQQEQIIAKRLSELGYLD